MHISAYLKKALYFAAEKHDGQYRKGSGYVPYIVHPVQVAFEVSTYTTDEDIIAAAFLHDTLEDCTDVSASLLQKEFNKKTARLVEEVSFIKRKRYTTWKEKKVDYLNKIRKASKEALLIVAVDKMSNLKAYFGALKSKGNIIALNFDGTPDKYRWYYSEIGNILVSKLGEHKIVKDYIETLNLHKKGL